MPTIDWPEALVPQTAQFNLCKSTVQFASPFNGNPQAFDFIAERWVLSCSLAQMSARNPRGVDAFCNQLAGGIDRVRVWAFYAGTPRGTLRGTVTLSAGVVRGNTTLPVTGGTAASGSGPVTLLQGDFIGCGGQIFMVAADVTLAGGAGSVPVVNRVRGTIASGSSVTWYRPTCEMVLPAQQAGPMRRPGAIDSAALDLIEVF